MVSKSLDSVQSGRILVVLPTWVGDLVMATPFLAALARRYPDARISLLGPRISRPILDGSPWAGRCHFWPPRDKSKAAREQHRALIATLRAEKFDLAVMLPNSLRSAWLCWRVGARFRLGYDRDGRGLLLTHRVPVPNRRPGGYEPMPLVEYYAGLARALDCEHPGDRLTLHTTPECDTRVSDRLRNEGFTGTTPLVVISPGASFGASKCWPPERFAAVADHLAERGMAIAISPGPGEEAVAESIAGHMRHQPLLLTHPCLDLGELKSLIRRSTLLLGNDTGPRHFARAFDIPRVTVFGPTEPRWTDTSHGGESIVRVDVPCGPCHQKVCPLEHRRCMDEITTDMVIRACEREIVAEPVRVGPT